MVISIELVAEFTKLQIALSPWSGRMTREKSLAAWAVPTPDSPLMVASVTVARARATRRMPIRGILTSWR
jgi:hypothetical protein